MLKVTTRFDVAFAGPGDDVPPGTIYMIASTDPSGSELGTLLRTCLPVNALRRFANMVLDECNKADLVESIEIEEPAR